MKFLYSFLLLCCFAVLHGAASVSSAQSVSKSFTLRNVVQTGNPTEYASSRNSSLFSSFYLIYEDDDTEDDEGQSTEKKKPDYQPFHFVTGSSCIVTGYCKKEVPLLHISGNFTASLPDIYIAIRVLRI